MEFHLTLPHLLGWHIAHQHKVVRRTEFHHKLLEEKKSSVHRGPKTRRHVVMPTGFKVESVKDKQGEISRLRFNNNAV